VRTPRFRTAYADAGLSWRGKEHTVAVSALRDLERKETRVEAGYSYDFCRGKGVSVRARQAPDATAWAVQGRVRPTLLGTPVGLSASVGEGVAVQTDRANVNWTTRGGWAQINAEHGPSGTWASSSMASAVHLDRQGVTFLGPAESFAVVDVPRQAGVPVRVCGRLVGKTNAQGRLAMGEVTPMVPTGVRMGDRALPLGTPYRHRWPPDWHALHLPGPDQDRTHVPPHWPGHRSGHGGQDGDRDDPGGLRRGVLFGAAAPRPDGGRGRGLQGPAACGPWGCANGGRGGLPMMGRAFGNKGLLCRRCCESGPLPWAERYLGPVF